MSQKGVPNVPGRLETNTIMDKYDYLRPIPMKNLLLICSLLFAAQAMAAPEVGQSAPAFTAQTTDGKTVKLSDFAGKVVVLEWYSPDCPFSRKFYSTGKMPEFQKQVIAQGAVWISINSGGKIADLKSSAAADHNAASAVIDDADGKLGKTYGAKTTPHCFVIGKDGKLIYKGAIDNVPSAKSSDIDGATNYVLAAVSAAQSGKSPAQTNVKPYGCSVKY